MAFDDCDNMGFHAVERKVEPAVSGGGVSEGKFAVADRQRCGAVAICQAYFVLAVMPTPDLEHPLPPAHRHPPRDLPRRMRIRTPPSSFPAHTAPAPRPHPYSPAPPPPRP